VRIRAAYPVETPGNGTYNEKGPARPSARMKHRLLALVASVALVGAAFAGTAVTAPPAPEPAAEPVAQQQDPGNVTQDTAYLRLVHASPDAPAVDVLLNNETVAENLTFGNATGYLSLEGDDYNVTVTPAGNASTVVLETPVEVDAREATTVAVVGELNVGGNSTLEAVGFTDDALAPAEGEAALSIVHLSPDAPPVDVTTTVDNETVTLAENVSYLDGEDYFTVPAGDYTVDIRQAAPENDGEVVATANVTLESGSAYTAVAVGNLVPTEDGEPLQTVLLEDATTTITVPDEGTGNETNGNETA